jgi:hypothetical protein
MRLQPVILLIVAAAVCSPACATQHLVEVVWDASGRFRHATDIPPGKFVELCARLQPEQTVHWTFSAGQPVDFNVHFHVGKATEYSVRLDQVTRAEDTLRSTTKETHCWMWTNKSSDSVRLDAGLQR